MISCRNPIKVTVLLTILFVIATLLSVALTIRNTYSTARNNLQNTYLVRDTVLLDYSSKFNDEITIDGFGYPFSITLYLLKSEPTNSTENLLIYNLARNINGYVNNRLHLLPQSRIRFHPCTYKNTPLQFYVVKSTENFRKWEKNRLEFEERIEPREFCQNVTDDLLTYEYMVKTEDLYYVIFNFNGFIRTNFNVSQVLYVVQRDIIESQCSVSVNSYADCSLPIPYSSTYQKALLQLVSERRNNFVTTTFAVPCSFRDWFYAITCILAAAGVIAFTVAVAVLLVALHRCREKRIKANSNAVSLSGERQGDAAYENHIVYRPSSISYPQSVPEASAPFPSAPVLEDLGPDDTPLLKNPEGVLMEQPPPSYKAAFELSEYSPPPYSSENVQPPFK